MPKGYIVVCHRLVKDPRKRAGTIKRGALTGAGR